MSDGLVSIALLGSILSRDERTCEHMFENKLVLVLVREQEQNENIEKNKK